MTAISRPGTVTCSQCRSAIDSGARTCAHCQATRRSVTSTSWTSFRDGRRNDIFLSALAFMLLSCLLAFATLSLATPRSATSISRCTVSHPDYPFC